MQFAEMSATEKVDLEEALKKYCSLTHWPWPVMEYFCLKCQKVNQSFVIVTGSKSSSDLLLLLHKQARHGEHVGTAR